MPTSSHFNVGTDVLSLVLAAAAATANNAAAAAAAAGAGGVCLACQMCIISVF